MTEKPKLESPFFASQRELAKYLGMDAVSVRRLMRRRVIPFVRLGGKILFRREDVEAVIARHTVPVAGARKGHAAGVGA